MLTFVKRHPARPLTIAADRKLWTSRCRQYRVAFSRCRYGPRDEDAGCPTCATLNTTTLLPVLGRPHVRRSLP